MSAGDAGLGGRERGVAVDAGPVDTKVFFRAGAFFVAPASRAARTSPIGQLHPTLLSSDST